MLKRVKRKVERRQNKLAAADDESGAGGCHQGNRADGSSSHGGACRPGDDRHATSTSCSPTPTPPPTPRHMHPESGFQHHVLFRIICVTPILAIKSDVIPVVTRVHASNSKFQSKPSFRPSSTPLRPTLLSLIHPSLPLPHPSITSSPSSTTIHHRHMCPPNPSSPPPQPPGPQTPLPSTP